MSSQPKSAEIEDVLSSIRRLVAGSAAHNLDHGEQEAQEDQDEAASRHWKAEHAPDETPNAEQDAPSEVTKDHYHRADALLLTEALRVSDGPSELSDDAAPDAVLSDETDAFAQQEARSEETNGWSAARAWHDDALQDWTEAAEERAEDDSRLDGSEQDPMLEDDTSDAREDATKSTDSPDAHAPFFQSDESVPTHELGETPDREPQETPLPPTAPMQHEPDAPRQGFGFGGARRDDPVRHVPLSQLRAGPTPPKAPLVEEPKEQQQEASPTAGQFDGTADNGVPEGAGKTPIIAPEFSHRPVSRPVSRPIADSESPSSVTDEAVEHQASGSDTMMGIADAALEPAAAADRQAPAPMTPSSRQPDANEAGNEPDGAEAEIQTPEPLETDSSDSDLKVPEEPESEMAKSDDPDVLVDSGEEHHYATAASLIDPDETTQEHAIAPSYRASLNLFNARDPEIDEEVLRSMIVEIVHKELQGALGERVSQNIRKLVQREIIKALESRDLD